MSITALDVKTALAARHPIDEGWIYLTELRTKQGFGDFKHYGTALSQVRYLDAFAMHTWGSKGFRRVGYEVKVARSDWKLELSNPNKHMQGYFLTHEFWYALAPGVYKDGDDLAAIEGCGILLMQEDGTFKQRQHAHHHQAWPMPETFIASLLNTAMRGSAQYAKEYAEMDIEGRGQEPQPVVKMPTLPKDESPFQQVSLFKVVPDDEDEAVAS